MEKEEVKIVTKEEKPKVQLQMTKIETKPPTYIILAGEVTHRDIPEAYAYVIAKDGNYIKRKNFLYSALFKIEKNPLLGDADSSMVTFDSTIKIPLEIFKGIERLFSEIYKKHQSEAAVILWRNSNNDWSFQVPEQTISAASVSYTSAKKSLYYFNGEFVESLPAGDWKQLGSIHSHAAMGAFHSGVDDKDEYNFDGIHITIGSFNANQRTYSCRYMFGDAVLPNRKMSDVIAGWVEETSGELYPSEVLALFQKPATYTYKTGSYDSSNVKSFPVAQLGSQTTTISTTKVSTNTISEQKALTLPEKVNPELPIGAGVDDIDGVVMHGED
ncbi:MAG: hypothetical protein M0P71_00785 [Melioribacteraceae bacterium]|nr:hypothetical protein [Melioribacteraceae bacterium]